MWLGPVLYLSVSVFLWWYAGAVFMPLLVTRSVVRAVPLLEDLQLVVIINAGLVYWLANVLVVYPVLGRGVLGYMLPQGWMSASFPLLVSHWVFARGLQFQ